MEFVQDDMSYILGHKGSTRDKIAKASGAILQQVGKYAFIAGDQAQRSRCRDYLGWVLQQRDGKEVDVDPLDRTDMAHVDVLEDDIGYLLGAGRHQVRQIE